MANNAEPFLPNGSTALAVAVVNPSTGAYSSGASAIDVMTGQDTGLAPFALRGIRISCPSGVETVVQDAPTTLIASAAGVALTAVSASAADVGVVLLVEALGANYEALPPFEITLNGTAAVALPGGPFTRINSLYRKSGDIVGNVTIKNGASVHAALTPGAQISRSALYTVPRGRRMFILDAAASVTKSGGSSGGVKFSIQAKPCASVGYGALFDWACAPTGASFAEVSQKYGQAFTGPLDLRLTVLASNSGFDAQVYASGIVQRI